MKGLQNNSPSPAVSSYRPRFMILVVISACILFTLVVSACNANLFSSASAASIAHASTASPSAGYPVKVFFSKFPQSGSTPYTVYPVNRMSPTIAVGTFAIELFGTPARWRSRLHADAEQEGYGSANGNRDNQILPEPHVGGDRCRCTCDRGN